MGPAIKLVTLLVVGSLLPASGQTSDPEDVWKVDLEQGAIEVTKTKTEDGTQYYAFKSIPFAKAPVGDLRFKNPEPAGPWTGVRNGSIPSPPCPQVDFELARSGSKKVIGNEDCLYLDIYVPKKNASEFPVMVWIHAGGFSRGSASEYNPAPLLKHDVVVVLIQYRLNILGFLSTDDSTMPGNNGLKDQVMALRWIKDNIKAFGGDPNRVTVFGESAGAESTHYLMLSPMAKGLFHGAIAQSGTALTPFMRIYSPRQNAAKLGQKLECPNVAPENLDSQALYDCLKSKSAETLVLSKSSPGGFVITIPFVDGEFLPEHPADMMRDGNYQKVNFMTGITRDDGASDVRQFWLDESRRQDLANDFSNEGHVLLEIGAESKTSPEYIAKRLFAHFIGDFNITEENIDSAVKMFTDYWFAVPCDLSGKMHARDAPYGTKTYLYEFHHLGLFSFLDSPKLTVGKHWIAHFDEVQYLFDTTFEPPGQPRPIDEFMSEVMVALWTNFARTGNPTPDLSLGFKWSPVTGPNLPYLILQPSPYMRNFTREKELELITNLPLDQNRRLFPDRFGRDEM